MKAFRALLSASWRYSKGRHATLLLYAGLFVCANIVLLLEPIVIARVLDTIQNIATVTHPLRTLGELFFLMLAIQVAFWLFHGPARVMENNVSFHTKVSFADSLFRIVTSLPVQWHKDHHSGQTINRIRKSTNAVYEFLSNGFQLIEMVMRLVGSVIALFILFPIAGFLAIAISGVALCIVFLFDRVLLPQYDAINEKEHHVASALHDYLTNVFTVISLRLEQLTRSELLTRMQNYFPLYNTNNKINEVKWFIATVVIALMTVVVLGWYAAATLGAGSALLVGTVYMLYEYLQKIGNSFYTFAWKYSLTVQQYADLLSVKEILDAAPAEKVDAMLPSNWSTIEISQLRFSYEDEEHHRHHLDDAFLTLKRGKKIALVGESGSGKSTMMSLIRGLQLPHAAVVKCDGRELADGLSTLARHVTLIPQEPEIFNNTIEYNVSVDTEQSLEELNRDIDLACFRTVVDRLPKGIHTDVSEKGVNLSGGEKQRLALARGIFASKNSDIILLDEPTSSVDSVNELQIHKNLFGAFPDRAIVASIHRLHLLPLFDEVYVLQHGKVVEHGTPKELMNGSGLLGSMWKAYELQKQKLETAPES